MGAVLDEKKEKTISDNILKKKKSFIKSNLFWKIVLFEFFF
jgi:hypothetical protein